jgi:hypothetical protein
MKRFEIYENTEWDRYMIFIFEERRLVGVNFHHGIGDFDDSYLESDEHLFGIYLTRMKGAAQDSTPVSILNDSIAEHLIKLNDYERDYIVKEEADHIMETLTERLLDKLYIKREELTNGQKMMIEYMMDDVVNTWKQISTAHIKQVK